MGLPQRDMIGLNEWMALLVSTGNPNRDALACDCATQLTTPELASSIYNEDYRVVGRYLTGSVGSGDSKRDKFLTREEAEMMFGLGLNAFCIFQDDLDWWQAGHDDLSDYFGYARGYVDANKAIDAARELGVPDGEYIYFAVDYDFMEDEVYSKIIPHFSGINDCMSNRGNPYNVGIYSARNTCGIVSAQGLAASSFVSDMSTGYSGNLGYPLPSNWAFDQIKEYTNPAGVPIDKDATSGRYMGFNTLQGPLMSTVEKGATVNYVDNNYDVEASSYMALERYTTNQEGRFRYALATESLCNVLDPGELFRGIRGVKIEIEAYDGAYFDLSVEGAGSTGCFPEVEEKTILEKRVEETIVKQVIGIVLSAIEIRSRAVKFGVGMIAKVLMGLNEAMSASSNGSTKLMREFRWDTLQDQTNQAMVFYPVFPTQGGYFEVTYTVECGSISGGSTKTLANTLTISNPR